MKVDLPNPGMLIQRSVIDRQRARSAIGKTSLRDGGNREPIMRRATESRRAMPMRQASTPTVIQDLLEEITPDRDPSGDKTRRGLRPVKATGN
jgi:hypothetical protein